MNIGQQIVSKSHLLLKYNDLFPANMHIVIFVLRIINLLCNLIKIQILCLSFAYKHSLDKGSAFQSYCLSNLY